MRLCAGKRPPDAAGNPSREQATRIPAGRPRSADSQLDPVPGRPRIQPGIRVAPAPGMYPPRRAPCRCARAGGGAAELSARPRCRARMPAFRLVCARAGAHAQRVCVCVRARGQARSCSRSSPSSSSPSSCSSSSAPEPTAGPRMRVCAPPACAARVTVSAGEGGSRRAGDCDAAAARRPPARPGPPRWPQCRRGSVGGRRPGAVVRLAPISPRASLRFRLAWHW